MSWAPWRWRGGKNPPKADLGQELGMYWHPELKRWVEQGKEEEYKKEVEAMAAPPSCGPASGPASYTLERTSLQSRYVATPGFSSGDDMGKETPPRSFGSLVPKTGARAAPANIFVPPPLEHKSEDPTGGEEGVGSDEGVADPSLDAEQVGCSGREMDETIAEPHTGGWSLVYGDEQWDRANGKPQGSDLGPWQRASCSGEDDVENSVQQGKSPAGALTTFLDYQGVTGEGDALIHGVGVGFTQNLISESPCDAEGGAFVAGGVSNGLLGGLENDSWRGKDTFHVVDEDIAEQNTVMSSEQPEDGIVGTSAEQETCGGEPDFSWVCKNWSEETWQNFYSWLDEHFGRDNWNMWSTENWTDFWKWYIENVTATQQDGDPAQSQDLDLYEDEALTGGPTSPNGEMQRKHSVENPKELFQIAFAQGQGSSESQQGNHNRSQQSGYEADSAESRQMPTLSVENGGAAAGAEEAMVLGLGLIRTGESLEGGQAVASPKNYHLEQRGAIGEGTALSGVSSTPLAASSPELGVFEGDGQILKKRSKLTGPLPWEDDAETVDSAGQLTEPCSPTGGQLRQQEHLNTLASDMGMPATRKLAPISIGDHKRATRPATREASLDTCLQGAVTTRKQTTGGVEDQEHPSIRTYEQQNLSPKRDIKAGEACESTLEDSAREGFGGVLEKQQIFKEPAVKSLSVQPVTIAAGKEVPALPGSVDRGNECLANKDECIEIGKDKHQLDVMEKSNGRIIQLSSGLLGRLENITDLGAMLFELQDLLHYVDSSDGRVSERKQNAQVRLVQLMDALGLGEHTRDMEFKREEATIVPHLFESMDSVNKPPRVSPLTVPVKEMEKLNQELCDMKDEMDDMALALGLESSKLEALRQLCERQGLDTEAIIQQVEENFGIQRESFQPEDCDLAGPASQSPKAGGRQSVEDQPLLKLSKNPYSDLQPAHDVLQPPAMLSDANANQHDTSFV